jgi:hypothetical protein
VTWEGTHANIVLAVRGVPTVICSCGVAGCSTNGRVIDVLEEFIAHVCVFSILMFPDVNSIGRWFYMTKKKKKGRTHQ